MNAIRGFVLKFLDFSARVAIRVLVAYMLLFLGAFGLDYWKDAAKYPALQKVAELNARIEGPAVALLRRSVPTAFDGIDIAPWMFLCAIFTLIAFLSIYRERLFNQGAELARRQRQKEREVALAEDRAARERERQEAAARADAEWRARQAAETRAEAERERRQREQLEAIAQVQREALAKAETEAFEREERRAAEEKGTTVPRFREGASRDELLEIMAKAKKSLEKQKRNLSFLAIDVVDSTGMKQGEDPAIAARDFKQYRKLVEAAIEKHGGIKAAWTPDGVMICFRTVESAVNAAKQVIRDLGEFNRSVKAMRGDFSVRCGINAGAVLFDDTVPMEEMSDRAIDIAGHMQKYALANTIFIGKQAIEGMRLSAEFRAAGREIDGCEVYQWGPAPAAGGDAAARSAAVSA